MNQSHLSILLAIRQFWADHGFAPTHRELCKMLGRSSVGGLHIPLAYLKETGYVDFLYGSPRTLRLTQEGETMTAQAEGVEEYER